MKALSLPIGGTGYKPAPAEKKSLLLSFAKLRIVE